MNDPAFSVLSRIKQIAEKQISAVYKNQQNDTNKILKLVSLYSELATAGLMDGKRKDGLKTEIINLINSQ